MRRVRLSPSLGRAQIPRRSLWLPHIAAMFTMAVAQPLYDLFAREDNATFFVAHQAQAIDVWVFVATLSLLFPLAIFAALLLVSLLSKRLAAVLYVSVFATLAAALFLPVTEAIVPAHSSLAISCGLAAALSATILYVFTRPAPSFVSAVSVIIVIAPAFFLSSAPMRSLLSAEDGDDTAMLSVRPGMPSVVMILFDELPLISLLDEERRIDPVRFPNFHRLAETSTWYRSATAVYSYTYQAVPAILTGRYSPHSKRFPGVELFPDNLFSVLAETHRVRAVESVTKLAGASVDEREFRKPLVDRIRSLFVDASVVAAHLVLPAAIADRLPVIEGQWQGFLADPEGSPTAPADWPFVGERPEKVRLFLRMLDQADPTVPNLHFLHVELPHYPFLYADDGRSYGPQITKRGGGARTVGQERLAKDPETSRLVYQAHLLQTRFVDLLLGMILDRLEERGLFEESVVIVLADHGAGFMWNGGLRADAFTNMQASEILYVPLLIKSPRQSKGEVSDRLVETIDVVPTLVDMLDLETSWKFDGASVFSAEQPDRNRVAHIAKRMTFGPIVDPSHTPLRRKIAAFGSNDLESLYFYGPHKEILGAPVQSFRILDLVATRKKRAADHAFVRVDLSSSHLPAYFDGEITKLPAGLDSAGLALAIAVNGTIRNTMRAIVEDGEIGFVSRIPPHALVSGRNQIDVYAIVEDQEGGPVSLVHLVPE